MNKCQWEFSNKKGRNILSLAFYPQHDSDSPKMLVWAPYMHVSFKVYNHETGQDVEDNVLVVYHQAERHTGSLMFF